MSSSPSITETKPTSFLATKNPHSRDAHIHFDEGPHKYTIQGINGVTADTEFTSVTTMVHQHFEHFDAKKVIAAMMRNQKKWNDPVANAKYYGKTAEEIEEMWKNAGQDAAAKGTAMHYEIECFYNTPPDAPDATDNTDDTRTVSRRGGADPPELEYFKNFHNEHVAGEQSILRPYRTEWTVFHEEAQIAGSIDMVYEDTDTTDPTPLERSCYATNASSSESRTVSPHRGVDSSIERSCDAPLASFGSRRTVSRRWGADTPLAIYDWKRCREISKTNRANKFATHPAIEHLPDTNFWHYALQLNVYKYILQTKYDRRVTDLYIIVLHPEAQNYQRIKLPDLQSEVAELFEERIRNFAAAAAADAK
jgi:hypothetical protein